MIERAHHRPMFMGLQFVGPVEDVPGIAKLRIGPLFRHPVAVHAANAVPQEPNVRQIRYPSPPLGRYTISQWHQQPMDWTNPCSSMPNDNHHSLQLYFSLINSPRAVAAYDGPTPTASEYKHCHASHQLLEVPNTPLLLQCLRLLKYVSCR